MIKSLKKYFPLFVLPTLICFAVAFIIPFLMGVVLSFCKFTTVTDAQPVGLQNYVLAFTYNNDFWYSLGFTALFAFVSVISVNVLSFILALVLSKGIKGTNLFRGVFFLPNLIGGIVLGYIWNLLINGVLLSAGVDITYKAEYGFWGLVVLTNWQMVGYMMVIYIAGFQNVSEDLVEAASIDGASKLQILFRVKIPMMMPSISICMFLVLVNSFKLFDQNLALTGGAPENATQMLALNIYNTFYGLTGWQGVGQAKAVIFFIIVAVIAFVQLRATSSKEVTN